MSFINCESSFAGEAQFIALIIVLSLSTLLALIRAIGIFPLTLLRQNTPNLLRGCFTYLVILCAELILLAILPLLYPWGYSPPIPLSQNWTFSNQEAVNHEKLTLIVDPQITQDFVEKHKPKIKPAVYPKAAMFLAGDILRRIDTSATKDLNIVFSETSFFFDKPDQIETFFIQLHNFFKNIPQVTFWVGASAQRHNIVLYSERKENKLKRPLVIRLKKYLLPIIETPLFGLGAKKSRLYCRKILNLTSFKTTTLTL